MRILAKHTDGYYYKAKILKYYSKYSCYIAWDDNTTKDRIKSIKNIIKIPKKTQKNSGINYLLISSLLLEGT